MKVKESSTYFPKTDSSENKLGYCFAGYNIGRLNKNQSRSASEVE